MWSANMTNLTMTEGDYGIILPITVSGVTLTAQDEIQITIKSQVNGTDMLVKTYGSIQNNTINFELTEEETALFPVGAYVYRMDWYQSGAFMCCLIECATFKVVDKA